MKVNKVRQFFLLIVFFLTLEAILGVAPAHAWYGYVVKVLDGDSLRVKRGRKIYEIRLYGIDAPEYKQPYGERAKEYATARMLRQTVKVEPKDIDQYNRIVALVTSQGRLVNRDLVKNGLAWVSSKYCRQQPLCRTMKKEEKRARKKRLGLWKDKHPVPPWRWKHRR